MIDEKKIEKAAKKYASFIDSNDIKTAMEIGFKAGIDWFLKNLWHPASEVPKENMFVLTDTQSIANKGYICWHPAKLSQNGFIRNWSNFVKATKITRWLYIDDLMKGGSNG